MNNNVNDVEDFGEFNEYVRVFSKEKVIRYFNKVNESLVDNVLKTTNYMYMSKKEGSLEDIDTIFDDTISYLALISNKNYDKNDENNKILVNRYLNDITKVLEKYNSDVRLYSINKK